MDFSTSLKKKRERLFPEEGGSTGGAIVDHERTSAKGGLKNDYMDRFPPTTAARGGDDQGGMNFSQE